MNKTFIAILSSLIGIIFFSIILIYSDKKVYFSLKGSSIVTVNIGDEYEDEGFSALYCTKYFKLFCKNINNKVVISKNNKKDFSKEYINYVLAYKNTSKILVREINYKDLESPKIELKTTDSLLCPGEEYVEEGYRAYDNIDGDLTDNVVIKKSDNKIYYSVSDSSGNKKVVYRTIKYNDTTPPNIELKGKRKSYSFINMKYDDPGVYAYDNCDGNITKKIVVDSNVDITKKGDYKINYSIQDTMGNISTITREVIIYDDTSKIEKNGKTVYLTFDDGPCIYTESILNVLNKFNVKATFFVTNQFSGYQNIIKKEYESGHTIAVHTYSHNYEKVYSSLENYIEDFNLMNDIIYKETGEYTNIFRFPGGSSNTISRFNRGIMTSIANEMITNGYFYFDWNVDSNDTGSTDPNVIANNVINGMIQNNYSVVLMHDIKKANIESIEKIIKYGLDNGYTFLPLEENSPIVRHKINN